MNQRIKLLAEQAGMYIVDDEFSTYGKFAEKFALLIVRECAGLCNEIREYGEYPEAEAKACAEYISKHFGVEA